MTTTKRKSRSKFAKVRHPFLYKVFRADGTHKVKKAWAKVIHAKHAVDLVLTAEHVRKSIALKGVGDTSTCSVAVCTYNHADKFSHKIEGHVDWNYSRAFIVSKVDKFGLPCECVAYEHADEIAHLNDTPGGQQQLLRRIKRDGPITIRLKPIRIRSEEGRPGRNRKSTGKRDPLKQLKGAKLRYAMAQLGAQPTDVKV